MSQLPAAIEIVGKKSTAPCHTCQVFKFSKPTRDSRDCPLRPQEPNVPGTVSSCASPWLRGQSSFLGTAHLRADPAELWRGSPVPNLLLTHHAHLLLCDDALYLLVQNPLLLDLGGQRWGRSPWSSPQSPLIKTLATRCQVGLSCV